MVTLPAEGRWSIKSLTDADVPAALAFLQRDPLINVYLISRLLEDRANAANQMVEVRYNRAIVLVASLATNVVLAGDPETPRDITHTAISVVAPSRRDTADTVPVLAMPDARSTTTGVPLE